MKILKRLLRSLASGARKVAEKTDSLVTNALFAVGAFAIALIDEAIYLIRLFLRTSSSRLPRPLNVFFARTYHRIRFRYNELQSQVIWPKVPEGERGDVPGWVLVVLMTTGLVTALWTIAAPRLSTILKNSLDAMSGIR